VIVVIMGVTGCGKTTVGAQVAARLGVGFAEGDRFHPPANVTKMSRGEPLADADRWPWLAEIAAEIDRVHTAGAGLVVGCSALKRGYRDVLIGPRRAVRLVYLKGTPELIAARLAARHGHFMPASLLPSQFAALEEPGPDERPIVADVSAPPEQIVDRVLAALACGAAGQQRSGGGA
jgi:carbohydrate kinase (thermoresistant glucokinase family)